jgi:hypothetical protein
MDAISRQLSAISQTLKTKYQAEQWQLKAISGNLIAGWTISSCSSFDRSSPLS